ncbi:unnamed protein product [Prunus armeniaca]
MRDVGILALKVKISIFSTCQVSSRRVKLGILLSKGALQLRYHRPQIRRLLLITGLLDGKFAN